jgi:hypothetical protein
MSATRIFERAKPLQGTYGVNVLLSWTRERLAGDKFCTTSGNCFGNPDLISLSRGVS